MLRDVFEAEGETVARGCTEWHNGELRGLDSIKISLLKEIRHDKVCGAYSAHFREKRNKIGGLEL